MNKLFALILLLATACASTKFEKYTAPPRILKGEEILFMEIANMNESEAYDLISLAEEIFSKTNRLKYLPEQEYNLLSKGISKDLMYDHASSDSILSVHTKCRYLVYSELVSSKEGDSYGYYNENELNIHNAPYIEDNEVNSAIFWFKVIDVKGGIHESEFQVSTTISPMTFGEEEGESRVNMTTRSTAVFKAFSKGMKHIKKGIVSR